MDPSLDDFINYDIDNNKQRENALFDIDFLLDSPYSDKTDLFGNIPTYLPKTIQNMLEPEEIGIRNNVELNSENFPNIEYQPFNIDNCLDSEYMDGSIQNDVTESHNSPRSPPDSESHLNNNSKKITKREKAKEKAKAKQDALEQMLQQIDKKYIPEGFFDPNLDSKTRKKMIQVIRNRVSAQNSRDKKKCQIQKLEEVQSDIAKRNEYLEKENIVLKQKLTNVESERKVLLQQIQALQKRQATLCSNCRSNVDLVSDDNNGETTEGSTSLEMSNSSSPLLYRASGRRGNLFGFGVTFTTIMCFLLFISQFDKSSITNLWTFPPDGEWDNSEKPENPRNVEYTYKHFESGINEFLSEEYLMPKFKWLMEQFDSFHKEVYKSSEESEVIVDLPQKENEPFSTKINNTKTQKKPFLGKNATGKIVKNQTSTFFFSNGFEVQRNESNITFDTNTEQVCTDCSGEDLMSSNNEPAELQKTDFIQLFIPKSAMGELTAGQNSSDFNYLISNENADGEESNTLLEVWCKIFAVREVSTSL